MDVIYGIQPGVISLKILKNLNFGTNLPNPFPLYYKDV